METPFIAVYLPYCHYAEQPELRADIQGYRDASQFGINRGRISKLVIRRAHVDVLAQAVGAPHERSVVLLQL